MSRNSSKGERPKRSKVNAFFLRGLVTVLPVVFTVFIFVVVINFVNSYVTAPINGTIYWTLEHNGLGWRALRSMGIEPYDPKYVHLSALPVELRSQFTSAGPTKEVMQSISDYRARHEDFFRDFDATSIRSSVWPCRSWSC
jgi:hypothetical protein